MARLMFWELMEETLSLREDVAKKLGVPMEQIAVTVDPRPDRPLLTIHVYREPQ